MAYKLRDFALLALASMGCANDRPSEGETSGGPGITETPTADTGIGELAGDDDGPKLDISGAADGTAGGDELGSEGCKKVDFLFVIDSSPSMEDEQDNLLTSFPGFLDAISSSLEIDDFHLMVIDASEIDGGGCDGTLGAGLRESAAGQDCMLSGDLRYATQDQPDLAATFSCMGARGFDGDPNERTMDSLTAAIGPLLAPGGCNEGFLRDDAVLVVTIITDEEDSPGDSQQDPSLDGSCEPVDSDPNSNGDPGAWHDAVIAAKNGDADAMVVLALTGDCDAGGDCPGIAFDPFDDDSPVTGAEPAPRVREFASSFGFGSVGPVCAADYSGFFSDAVSVIASACDGFVPPG
jgi:hypothetical protein